MINTKRLVNELKELVSIDSVSFHEQKMIETLKKKLFDLHFDVYEDHKGNLYGFLKGELPGEPLLFSAHMDTVEPGSFKEAIIQEDGKIVSNGKTVLGADDVAGIVAILESVRVLLDHHIAHRDIEVLFFVAEEAYIQGSQDFDFQRVRAKEGYVLDLSGNIGTASLQEPTLISFQIDVIGKASHAGFAPEEGIHSIAVASQAIAHMKQGQIDEETTLNIGKIHGGIATNIVPEHTFIEGEVRSYNHDQALATMQSVFQTFEMMAKQNDASINTQYRIHLHAYQVSKNEQVVQRFLHVCEKLNLSSTLTKTFGGSDNNSFLSHGIQGIVLACGMHDVHTTHEYTTIEDLKKSTEVVLNLMISEE